MKKFILSFIFFIFPILLNAQQKNIDLKKIDRSVKKTMKEFKIPGVSIALVKSGEVVLTKGYGVQEIGKTKKVNARTRFAIASNTKAFTATGLALLKEQGTIHWEDKVIEHLPWFRLSDPYVTHELTIKDLLVHRSGLGLGAGDLLWWPPSTYSRDEIVRRLQYIPLQSSFRNTYAYDNVLYLVAGTIIETKSGLSWGEFIQQNIFNPIGMTSSTVHGIHYNQGENIAAPHALIDGKIVTVEPFLEKNVGPAGSIMSNAIDMAKWMITQLDSGRTNSGKRLFSRSTTRELWSIVTPISIPSYPALLKSIQPQFSGYALGFRIHDYRGYKIVTHTGGLPGYVSRITLLPRKKIGIMVLTNQESGAAFNAITNTILDLLLYESDTEWIKIYKKMVTEQDSMVYAFVNSVSSNRDETSTPSLDLTAYTGTYHDQWYGDIVISQEQKHLTINFTHTPDLTGQLEHWQYDTFIARWNKRELRADAYLSFTLQPDGSIDHATMKPISPATDFSFDFQDLHLKPVFNKKDKQ